jgi:predicted NBD/HSP70 family sugar kinase/predicted transcriptional regulator
MTEIVRPDDMRRQNRAKILAALRMDGHLSRTGISQKTGLSAATVSAITADLLKSGILLHHEENDQTTTGRGRPRVALAFNPEYACIGAIVLQLNEITVSIADFVGNVRHESRVEVSTTSISSDHLLRAMCDALESGYAKSGQAFPPLKHITVGVQGTTDVKNTLLMWSPITSSREIPIQNYLAQKFGATVSVHNDCNMIARALRHNEPQIYHSDFAAILLSHGIGMGLYHNGKLVGGKHSSAAEFGHMTHIADGALCRCGRHGCIEAYAGDYAIYRRAKKEPLSSPPHDHIHLHDFEGISKLARNGNTDCLAAFEAAGTAIGAGLASLYALFDSFPVAFVGAGAGAHDLLEAAIIKAIGLSQPPFQPDNMPIRYYPDDRPLVQKGCTITALMEIDRSIRSNRANKKAKELNNVG